VAGLINNFLKQVTTADTVKGFAHANRIFVGNALQLSPKFEFLFHISFDYSESVSKIQRQTVLETGLMIKSAELPKFNIDTKTLNSYNRPAIVQTGVKFQPVTLTFHDDSANVVRNFWRDYYQFYYRNSDLELVSYVDNDKYATNINVLNRNKMGFTPRSMTSDRYLNAIRLYSLSRKRFSEYVLVNPIISGFQHGRHNQSTDTGTLEHSMTVEYETVLYSEGSVQGGQPGGFATLAYDNTPSSLTPTGGTRSLVGPGGLFGTASSVVGDLAEGNFLSAAFKTARAARTFKGANFKQIAQAEAGGLARDVLRGQNPFSRISIPSLPDLSRNTLPDADLSTNTTLARDPLAAIEVPSYFSDPRYAVTANQTQAISGAGSNDTRVEVRPVASSTVVGRPLNTPPPPVNPGE
jgi:hypothetical protein